MELRYVKLAPEQVEDELARLPGWQVESGELVRVFEFGSYPDAALFASACAQVSQRLNHHPDLLLTYGKVRVSVHTHDVGGLSPYDFELARRIDALAR